MFMRPDRSAELDDKAGVEREATNQRGQGAGPTEGKKRKQGKLSNNKLQIYINKTNS